MATAERRLLRELPVLRRHLNRSGLLALLTAAAIVAQADLLAAVLADGFAGHGAGGTYGLPAAPLLALTAVMAARAILAWARIVLARRAAAEAKTHLRARLAQHLARLGPRHAHEHRHGETATLLTRGLDALDPYVTGALPARTAAVVVPLVVVARIAVADLPSALLVVVTLPLIPVFGALVGAHTARRTARQWKLLARLGGHFLDAVAGLPTLRAFGRARHQTGVVREMADAHRRATVRTLRVAFLSALVLETAATLSVALVAVPLGLRLLGGTAELRTALLVLFLAPEAFLPLRAAGAAFHDGAEGVAVAERACALLDTPPPAYGGTRAPAAGHALSLTDVTVRFPGRAAPALDRVTLHIRPGEHVALVGPSGAGKSTLLALLLGFVAPDSGTVRAGGARLADLDLEAWRAGVAWVPQHPHLFAGTVADNIRLGRPDATEAAVRAAARAAAAHEFIARLPQGYATPLGEHGAGLSTGQRQRLALARAHLRDAQILLLDEPTAHLDPRSEAEVSRATARLMRGRTCVVVAHRPALLPHADRVITLHAPDRSPV